MGRVLPAVVVAVLALDAVLLAWTELAWVTVTVTPLRIPWAALLALVTTPLLVLAADRVMPGTRAPLVPLAAWTLTIVVPGLWSPAGGGVLPGDVRAILLLALGILPGVVAATRSAARPVPVTPRG